MSVMSAGSSPLRPRRVAATIALAVSTWLAALVGMPWVAVAQDASSPAPKMATTITVHFEPSRMDGIPHYLAARLVAADGSAAVGERVQIRRTVDVFGGRSVTLGRANTDNAGIARVAIEPREEVYAVSASFTGSDTLSPSEVVDDIVFPSELVIIPEHAPRGGLVDPQLRPLADVMPLVIGAGVVVVWLVLLGVTFLTLLHIRSTSRSDRTAPDRLSADVPGTTSGPQGG